MRQHCATISRMLFRSNAYAPLRGARFARTALLWLALVLALAQLVAIRHAYSHVPGDIGTQSGSKHPGAIAHCDACIAAVTLGGAAPPPPALVFAALGRQLPQLFAPADHPFAPQQRPYAIRAPPAIAS